MVKMRICHITINPIDFERRIQNQAMSAHRAGHQIWVLAIGRLDEAKQEITKNYTLWRFRTRFYHRGPIKFLNFNLRIFFFLLFRRINIIHCHDLWVLPAAALLTLFKKCYLVYDAHEFYQGLEIFTRKKLQKNIWMITERICIRQIDVLLSVSEPITRLYQKKYRNLKQTEVIRNLPLKNSTKDASLPPNWPETDKKIILYQGHFRPGRGLKYLLEAISMVPEVHLVLIGDGELRSRIEDDIEELGLHTRVTLLGYVPTEKLIQTCSNADLGVVLFEPTSLNYSYALPNKFFEYIMAGIPVLASDILTLREYVAKYDIGMTVNPHDVKAIASILRLMLSNEVQLAQWQQHARHASNTLNWEEEAKKLDRIYENL